MRVLFDAYWWSKGPGANRTVQRELITAWVENYPQDEVILALRGNAGEDDAPDQVERVRTRLWPHALSNRLELARLARRAQADAVVCHNYAPLGGRSVVFIHDVMFVEHPEWFSPLERVYFSPMLSWAKSAMAVAASTETEAERIMRLSPRLRQPTVTGLALPRALTGARGESALNLTNGLPYALTVGRLNVRKNLEHLLESAIRSSRIHPECPLLVVGNTDHSGRNATLTPAVKEAIDSGAIRMLGGVSNGELAALYSGTSLVITLSLDEGFGMPAIEAAHFGAPLLASDIPVFRETVDGYARFVPPRADQGVIAESIDATWGMSPTSAQRDRVVQRYTWSRAVSQLRDRTLRELHSG